MEKLEMKPPSARVISKMRNGHKVRVMKGTGFELLVNPATYSQITKSFTKGKGSTMQLTAEEILANKEIEGGALFKNLKKGFQKLGKELKKVAEPVIEKVKPLAEKAVEVATPVARKVANKIIQEAKDKGIPIAKSLAKEAIKQGVKVAPKALAALAVASGNPELAPAALAIGKPLSKEAGKQLEKQVDRIPEKKKIKAPRAPPTPAPRLPARNALAPRLPQAVQMDETDFENPVISMEGQGLYAGRGLYASSRGRGMFGGAVQYGGAGYRNPVSSVSGTLMNRKMNPALESQPQFVNEIMRRQMAPA